MARGIVAALLLVLALTVTAADGPATAVAPGAVQKVEASGLARLLGRVWAKLRAYVPRSDLPSAQGQRTQIAGVRGAESTASGLQPYWKGDKSKDPRYLEQLKAFNAAMALVDAGAYEKAAAAFQAFQRSYADSELNTNADFALAALYGQQGDRQQALTALQSFVAAHPQHPLAADAQQLLQALQAM